jgi:predicted RNA-binding protein with PIN domain
MASMPAYADRDPLAATRRLFVDGNNLTHAMAKTPGGAASTGLIARLRGAIPGQVTIELVFDGPAERGLRNERIGAGVVVRYSGARTADSLILTMVEDVRVADGPDGTAGLLVVTDDRELRHSVQMRGARTARTSWLIGRLGTGRLASPSVGNPRPARGSPPPSTAASQQDGDPAETDRPSWKAGRGATTKKGNPRKAPKAARTDRMRP